LLQPHRAASLCLTWNSSHWTRPVVIEKTIPSDEPALIQGIFTAVHWREAVYTLFALQNTIWMNTGVSRLTIETPSHFTFKHFISFAKVIWSVQ
jgi:hypothetical protein